MRIDSPEMCKSVHHWPRFAGLQRARKKPEHKAPAVQLVCARIKIEDSQIAVATGQSGKQAAAGYALRRGRTVRSRTCARMLDICIPFSCDR